MFLQRSKKIPAARPRHVSVARRPALLLEISPLRYHICLSRGKFGMGGSKYRLNCAKIHQFLTVS